MSGDAEILGISGTILADVEDLRSAASLIGGVGDGYRRSLQEFLRLWSREDGVGASLPVAGLPDIYALADRIEAVETYLRTAADQYDEADRFAQLSLADQATGATSTALSLFVAVPGGLASGTWRAPRLDPRVAGSLVDGAQRASDVVLSPLFRTMAFARESAARAATTRSGSQSDATPPRSVQDLAARVTEVGELGGGNVTVELVTGPDGTRRAIVYLRGTTRWDYGSADPADLDGNVVALAGHPTVYGQGAIEAMRAAGIHPDTPVMLVGHSQGGMVAANLTRQLAESGEFAVTDLVTFGAPFAEMDDPVADGVQLTALQHTSDVVPLADGRRNSHGAGSVTVTFGDGDRNIAAHDMDGYQRGAAALDASTAPAGLAVTARLSPFTSGSSSTVREYRVRRQQ